MSALVVGTKTGVGQGGKTGTAGQRTGTGFDKTIGVEVGKTGAKSIGVEVGKATGQIGKSEVAIGVEVGKTGNTGV